MIGKADFIKCDDYKKLKPGTYLVRVDEKERDDDLHVATVSNNKIVIVGGHFSWDRNPLVEYLDITHLVEIKQRKVT